MTKQNQTVYETWKQQGSISRGADELDMSLVRFRYNLKRYMKAHNIPMDDINIDHQNSVIQPKLRRQLGEFRRKLCQYPDQKWALFVEDGLIDYARADKARGDIIGVYNSLSNPDEVRDDVYWYVKNEMETENETAN